MLSTMHAHWHSRWPSELISSKWWCVRNAAKIVPKRPWKGLFGQRYLNLNFQKDFHVDSLSCSSSLSGAYHKVDSKWSRPALHRLVYLSGTHCGWSSTPRPFLLFETFTWPLCTKLHLYNTSCIGSSNRAHAWSEWDESYFDIHVLLCYVRQMVPGRPSPSLSASWPRPPSSSSSSPSSEEPAPPMAKAKVRVAAGMVASRHY